LKSSKANYLKIAALKQENPDLDLILPDPTEKAWDKLKSGSSVPA
jgi:hypothetical protein